MAQNESNNGTTGNKSAQQCFNDVKSFGTKDTAVSEKLVAVWRDNYTDHLNFCRTLNRRLVDMSDLIPSGCSFRSPNGSTSMGSGSVWAPTGESSLKMPVEAIVQSFGARVDINSSSVIVQGDFSMLFGAAPSAATGQLQVQSLAVVLPAYNPVVMNDLAHNTSLAYENYPYPLIFRITLPSVTVYRAKADGYTILHEHMSNV